MRLFTLGVLIYSLFIFSVSIAQTMPPSLEESKKEPIKYTGDIQTGKKYGMVLLDDYIMELFQSGKISADEAYAKANEKARFRPLLKSPPTDFTEV